MIIAVVCEFDNGETETLRDDFDDLGDAVRFALKGASDFSSDLANKPAQPVLLKVICDGRVELSIRA